MTTFFGRVLHDGVPRHVVVETETAFLLEGDPFNAWSRGRDLGLATDLRYLAPVVPSKVVAIGRNYRAHAEELGNDVPSEPLVFLKPPSAVIGPRADIVLPPESERVDHEAELTLVIATTCRRVSEANAHEFIFGYTAGNDVTARDLQQKDTQWSRAKGFDTFCPLGPLILPGLPSDDTTVECYVNDNRMQHGRIADLIFSIPRLVAHVSAVMTLHPGDIIMTGTPSGISRLAPGDRVRVTISGLPPLENAVRQEVH